jgi:hypothetical protein
MYEIIRMGLLFGHPSELLPIVIGTEKQITQEKYSN